MKRERTIIHITPGRGAWVATCEGHVLDWHEKKAFLVKTWRRQLSFIVVHAGIEGQIFIHGRDGKIQTEHTYGSDPRRSRG